MGLPGVKALKALVSGMLAEAARFALCQNSGNACKGSDSGVWGLKAQGFQS